MKTLLFVDDEPRIVQALQRQFHNMRHEWDMHFVVSGAEALDFMAGHSVEVIVTDSMMPGMDGAQLLTETARRHPDMIRLVLSGHADRQSILRLVGPGHQYISKPCSTDELRAAIARAFALRGLLSNAALKQLVAGIRSLPVLPSLHQQLSAELSREEPSIETAGEIISQDIGLATKMLQLVNSAFFGLAEPAATVSEAVLFLGLTTIRSLVLSLHVFSRFDSGSIRNFSPEQLAWHCRETGFVAKKIAQMQKCENKMSEQCFLAGMIHDVGQLILAAEMPGRYGPLLQRAAASGRPLWEVEEEELGATHAGVGAYLLGLWGLPNPVVEAVAFHHRPADCAARGFSPALAVHAADVLVHQHDAGPVRDHCEFDSAALAILGPKEQLEEAWRERSLQTA